MSVVDNTFLDTNILVYASDRSEATKGPQAQALLNHMLANGKPSISVQVLSEFYWTVTRKIPVKLTHDEAASQIGSFETLMHVAPLTLAVFQKALELSAQHQLSLWDAQVLAAALASNCSILLSEDFAHRQVLQGVSLVNPFAPDFAVSEIVSP